MTRSIIGRRWTFGIESKFLVIVLLTLCTTLAIALPAHADGPYSASTTRISASGGAGAGGFALGLDVGYFVYDGVEVSGGVTFFSTEDLDVLQVTPAIRYILALDPIDPYVGAFVRHWSFLGTDDASLWSAGVRGGIILRRGQLFLGAGLAREVVLDCPANIEDCTQVYPEITFAVHL